MKLKVIQFQFIISVLVFATSYNWNSTMKIYSKFRDSYDHNVSFGIDPGIVYNRVEQTLALYEYNPYLIHGKNMITGDSIDPKTLATIKVVVERVNKVRERVNFHRVDTLNDQLSWLFVNNQSYLYHRYKGELSEMTPDEFIARLRSYWQSSYTANMFDELMHTSDIHKFNTLLDCPIVLIYDDTVTLNPNLLQGAIVPTFNVFQEVQTFLSNKVNPITVLSDVVKRDKAGFDIKSFKHRKV